MGKVIDLEAVGDIRRRLRNLAAEKPHLFNGERFETFVDNAEGGIMDSQTDKVYTIDEAAELLKLNPMTIRREIKRGNLAAAKIGRTYRISKESLADYYRKIGGGELFQKNE